MATRDIAAGDIISMNYVHLLWPTPHRVNHLMHAKFFQCSCDRCYDPTELGLFLGSPCCSHCRGTLSEIIL